MIFFGAKCIWTPSLIFLADESIARNKDIQQQIEIWPHFLLTSIINVTQYFFCRSFKILPAKNLRFYKLFSRVYLYSKHIMYNFVIYSKLRTWMAPFLENEEIKLDMLWILISFTKNLVFWVKHRFANLCIVYYQTFYYLVWLENLITDEVWRVGRIYWQREISLILRLYSYALGMQCYWPDFFHSTPN